MTSSSQFASPGPALPSRPRVAAVPSTDDSLGLKLLPFVLSVIAGSLDVTGFLGLGGLFTAHIAGNVVVLEAKLVAGEPAPLSYVIAVPVFVITGHQRSLTREALTHRLR